MFFGIPQLYIIDIYGFYFEEYILGYLLENGFALNAKPSMIEISMQLKIF